jgi:hypothetical protein
MKLGGSLGSTKIEKTCYKNSIYFGLLVQFKSTIHTYSNPPNFNKNWGFTRLNITKKTLLTDSIYISADYAIIRRYNRLSIPKKLEIKLLLVRRGGRDRQDVQRWEERLADNKLGKNWLEFDKR